MNGGMAMNAKMRKQIITWIGFMGLFLSGVSFGGSPLTLTLHPHRGTLQKSFTEKARTRLSKIYRITMPLSGELDRIEMRPGMLVKQGETLGQLNQTPLQNEVKEAQAKLAVAQANFEYQTLQMSRRESLTRKGFVAQSDLDNILAQKKVFAAQISEAQAEISIAQYNLSRSTMRSPIEGVILWRYTQGGRWLNEGNPLLDIGTWGDLEVIADVLTQDAQQLKPGDAVFLSSIGSPDIIQAKINYIEPQGFTKKSSLGVEEQRVNVIMSLPEKRPPTLQAGYRLDAQFLISSARDKDALIIPRFSVLQDVTGKFYVFKVVRNRLVKQMVEIGIDTDTEIAITRGLTVNDTIVSQPTTDAAEGMKVKTRL